MVEIILLALVAALCSWGIVGTVVAVLRDGRRRVPTDWTRLP